MTHAERQLDDKQRPSLNMEDSATGARLEMFFGYKDGDPTVAIFKDDELDPVLMIPKGILQIAVEQGWTDQVNDCPDCAAHVDHDLRHQAPE